MPLLYRLQAHYRKLQVLMNVDNSAVGEGTMFPAGHPLLLGTLQLPVTKAMVKLMVMGKLH